MIFINILPFTVPQHFPLSADNTDTHLLSGLLQGITQPLGLLLRILGHLIRFHPRKGKYSVQSSDKFLFVLILHLKSPQQKCHGKANDHNYRIEESHLLFQTVPPSCAQNL